MLPGPLRADLRPIYTVRFFVACDKLTTGLRHDLRLLQRFKTCVKFYDIFSDGHVNRKSCRWPVVSLSHATKVVPCKSALNRPEVCHGCCASGFLM